MDVVYICRPGDNEELRYSIRSVVKNLRHDNIWVVGQKPDWYVGNFIPVPDKRLKYLNARNNLNAVVSDARISENFILMNDDFYIMKPVDTVEYFYSGSLEEKAMEQEFLSLLSGYPKMLYSTMDKLISLGFINPLSYELHVPMIMNKDKLKDVLKYKGQLWRSMYGNMYSVGGSLLKDVKVYPENSKKPQITWKNDSNTYLSSQDESFEMLKKYILNKFENKTKYEV